MGVDVRWHDAHRAKRRRWTDLIGLLEAIEAGAVSFSEGSRKVTELARDLGIADHHLVLPFYAPPMQQGATGGMANERIRQAVPKLLRHARDMPSNSALLTDAYSSPLRAQGGAAKRER